MSLHVTPLAFIADPVRICIDSLLTNSSVRRHRPRSYPETTFTSQPAFNGFMISRSPHVLSYPISLSPSTRHPTPPHTLSAITMLSFSDGHDCVFASGAILRDSFDGLLLFVFLCGTGSTHRRSSVELRRGGRLDWSGYANKHTVFWSLTSSFSLLSRELIRRQSDVELSRGCLGERRGLLPTP